MHKEVRKAVDYATRLGFTVRPLNGHTKAWIVCECGDHTKVFSTGKNPENGAKKIRRWVDKHKEHVKK